MDQLIATRAARAIVRASAKTGAHNLIGTSIDLIFRARSSPRTYADAYAAATSGKKNRRGRRDGLVGSDVTVTLEIEVAVPDGVTENVVRTVTENSRALKFMSRNRMIGRNRRNAPRGQGASKIIPERVVD